MMAIQCILCPVDFSDASHHAMEHAVAIAAWYKARLVALHAHHRLAAEQYDLVGAPPGVFLPPPPPDLTDLEKEMLGCLDGAHRAGVAVESMFHEGQATAAILDCAAASGCDLIVMGTHGTTGFEHLVLGSVTEKVLRKARCPVLTIPPRAQATSVLPYRRVVCAVDFSPPSRAGLDLALSLAHESGAALTVVHVIESPADEEPITLRSFNVPDYTRYHEQAARAEIAALLPEPPAEGWRADSRVAYGKPYREILRIAADDKADLIVMGVHGRNALEVMLFGSTTNQVVRRATCPVLTLRT